MTTMFVEFPCPTCVETVKVECDTVYRESLHPETATCPRCGNRYRFEDGAGYLSGFELAGSEPGECPTVEITITPTNGETP